jgi:diguanylate cyclase (GGDEF)-like protein/PAS domain S-box-containing protein
MLEPGKGTAQARKNGAAAGRLRAGRMARLARGYLERHGLGQPLQAKAVRCYALAFVFLAVALGVRVALGTWLGNMFSHPTVFIAVVLTAWYCGVHPAVAVAIVGYPAIEYLIRDVPFSNWAFEYLAASLGVYIVLNATIIFFVSSFRREHDRLQVAESALQESEEQFQQLATHIPEGFWITDLATREPIYVSPACERIHGALLPPLRHVVGAWKQTLHPEDRERVLAANRKMKAEPLDVQYRIIRPDGSVRWIHMRGYPVKNADGAVYRVAGTIEDVTERHDLEDRLYHEAHFDGLTGLPNRALFFDRLGQALNHARRGAYAVAVLFVDLDHFKNVNDTLGHLVGDKLLQRAAECLARAVRADDTVARLGGDEFGIILPHVEKADDAVRVAEKAITLLSEPFAIEGHDIRITASIGVAISSPAETDAQTLVSNADTAMFRAKGAGRNAFECYTSAMNAHALEQLDLERRLRRALELEEFVLHFQPKRDVATGQLTGCEALLRWERPEGRLMSPQEFLPTLEESGLIRRVGEWVIHAACRQIAEWEHAGIEPVPIGVNISARQFGEPRLASVVASALREHGVDGHFLQLELTESAAMQSSEQTITVADELKTLGVTLAIDHFGMAHASLADLTRLPIDALKIDRSFTADVPENEHNAALTKAIITMAHALGTTVVAQGIEKEAQAVFLAEHGCDEMQGFLLGRPVPAWEMAGIARERQTISVGTTLH